VSRVLMGSSGKVTPRAIMRPNWSVRGSVLVVTTASAWSLIAKRSNSLAPSHARRDRPVRFGGRLWRGIGTTWDGGWAVATAVGRRLCWGAWVVETR
jgi:hypothetical protein